MPYIKQQDRAKFYSTIDELIESVDLKAMTVGELNYLITKIVHAWVEAEGVSYTRLNSVIGVLECAKLELYRKVAAPYEEVKKLENGPVSVLDSNS